ncbi:MAG TPA: alpha/beta family hydrolase [Bacteroidota bacterium]|nr:alpha/beta family hydrolase [Bacteroidota bacterium]
MSGLLMVPPQARALLVFAHGAGAGMCHPFMEAMAAMLADAGIGTFRFQFPYMEKHTRRPDPKPLLLATVRSAVREAVLQANELPLFAGGKSMGGRMISMAQAEEPLDRVRGLVFFGFPLHPPGKPSTERAEHLSKMKIPMLFLQGTHDEFAELSLLTPIIKKLKKTATLHLIEHADHSFHVPKKSGRTDDDVLHELRDVVKQFVDRLAR